jgi:preprotein translocase subunit SecA
MLKRLLGSIGDSNERDLKRLQPVVDEINSLEGEFEGLSDAELRARGDSYRAELKEGETLDSLLPEVFAAVREAAKRRIGQRHFDVQLKGGIALHEGRIAEMKTGEGKTLVATLPVTLNGLGGEGVHVVTVNDYLAKRDAQWMGPVYHALGVSVGCIQHDGAFLYDPEYESEDDRMRNMGPIARREAYEADVTYGTNNEFGFDYLRDNMVVELAQCVQRDLNYAIVDEVDNILIDEARTPLIISGAGRDLSQNYYTLAKLTKGLREGVDYVIDQRTQAVTRTPEFDTKVERGLGLANLYDSEDDWLLHALDNALRAQVLQKRDRDYVVGPVEDGHQGVIIVDEFTGRKMPGRRFSDGLHQAIEAKEGLRVRQESRTMATITLQNYFRMYQKLAGMTGTAVTEAEEFDKIYKLDVLVIPTNKPMIREEYRDQIYKSEEGKYRAVVREIEECHGQGRPVLVGTVSVERSEHLSGLLQKTGVPHQVLNAKHHESEAAVVAQAGRVGAVTIATNMAGRGVDIILGGRPDGRDGSEWQDEHDKVVDLAGLHVIGTERHDARRIDNQLRGRAGRQGDPGSSRFYISLEDDLMRRFGGDRVKGVMEFVGFDEDTPLEHGLVGKVIENSQVKVEAYHFDIRKHLVEYDDVVNKHREVIYAKRRKILRGEDLKGEIKELVTAGISGVVHDHLLDEHGDNWDLDGLAGRMSAIFPLPAHLAKERLAQMSRMEVEQALLEYADTLYEEREGDLGPEVMRIAERVVRLRTIDRRWVEHLTEMDNMRQEVGLESLRQRDPLVAYKTRGFEMFKGLMEEVDNDVVHSIYHVRKREEGKPERKAERELTPVGARTGRNDPCPCGSGKKYKKCCGS